MNEVDKLLALTPLVNIEAPLRSKLYAKEIKGELEYALCRKKKQLRRVKQEIALCGDGDDLPAAQGLLEADIGEIEEELRQHELDGCFYWPALHDRKRKKIEP
jgi:hypothetical protein